MEEEKREFENANHPQEPLDGSERVGSANEVSGTSQSEFVSPEAERSSEFEQSRQATPETGSVSYQNAERSSENEASSNGESGTPPIPPIPPTRSGGGSGDGNEPPKKPRGKALLGYFLTGILGVIVGAIIVFFTVSGLGNDNSSSTSSSLGNTSSTKNNTVEKVSYKNSTDITKAVSKVQNAVVSVLNYQASSNSLESGIGGFGSGGSSGGDSNGSGSSSEEEASSGSGVIYKKANGKAYVVTNNHVVDGANKLEVTFSNGKKSTAKLIGTDEWNDLAVLEISDKNVTSVAKFGDSDALTVGENVIAIGSPLGTEFSGSVTQGIVSGLNRTVPVDINGDGQEDWEAEVIQTDAAINPGNSGGALINLEGQVIGINSMKISTENVEGIGFALPSNSVEPIISQLEEKGEVTRPALGVTLRDVDTIPDQQQKSVLKLPSNINYGAMVQQVTSNSAASKAGLKQYDVIVDINGQKITNTVELRKVLYNSNLQIGDKVTIKYYRDGKAKTTSLTLEEAKTTQQ
ncbi:trypsin-like peptidase domain-containing protein [Listeria aquatica]|uniref:trypsin-like peptidase domain-containing protein n=1 Tax=Listeria aquatica TaxID=1494960 RepID=UPI00162933E7